MKIVFNTLSLLLLLITHLSTVQADTKKYSTNDLIECAVSIVHLCTLKSCESVPVFFTPKDKFPLKLNLKTHEVISLYEEGEEHRSLVLEINDNLDRLEILGRAEKSSFNGQPVSWLMQIYYKTGDMILSGTGKDKGVVIFGSCRIDEVNRVAR